MTNLGHDEIDNGFKAIGEFGRYQASVFVMVGLTAFIPALLTYSYVFIAATPSFRCKLPNSSNDTYDVIHVEHDFFIPNNISGANSGSKFKSEACSINVRNETSGNNYTLKCNSWVYSKKYYEKTIVTDWNLVCDDASKKSTFATLYFAGSYGIVLFGVLSDKIGRKKMAYICIILNAIFNILIAILTNLFFLNLQLKQALFGVLRFVTGVTSNFYTLAVVLAVEITGPSKRVLATNVIYYFYIIGEFIAVLACYFIRDYNNIYIFLACFSSIYAFYFWLVPESPRWNLTNGKNTEALKVFKKIAESNKRVIPESYESYVMKTREDMPKKKDIGLLGTLRETFKSKKLAIRSLAIAFNWLTNNFVYYGISLGTGELSGDPYLNFSLFATNEFVAIVFSQFIFQKYGRKIPYVLFMVLAGVSLILIIILPKNLPALVTILALVGKFSISFTYNGVYIMTSEIYPTTIRSTSIALCQSIARCGSIVAPYINLLGQQYWYPIPFLIYGIFASVASILAFIFLPETKNVNLPDTIDDCK